MSNVYRYINNTDTDIISGAYLVPAFDQLMFKETQPVLDALVKKNELVGLVNGIQVGQEIEVLPSIAEEKELYDYVQEVPKAPVVVEPAPVVVPEPKAE